MLRFSRVMIAASMLWVSSAFAQDKKDAKEAIEHYDRGVALYKASSYEAALVEFESAYRGSANFRLLYNIALCKMETKDPVGAIESFRRYLAEGGDQIDKSKRDDVGEQIQKLQLSVTKVTIRSNAPTGADLLVDDEKVAKFPLTGPIPVKVGTRRFTVTFGSQSVTRAVPVTGGENPSIELTLAESGSSEPVGMTQPPTSGGTAATGRPGFPWIPWAITGAFGAATVVTGIVAVGARNDAALAQARFGSRAGDIEPDQNRANTFGIVTDVLLGATLVSAGLATFFTIRHYRKPSEAPKAALHVGPRGFAIVGGF